MVIQQTQRWWYLRTFFFGLAWLLTLPLLMLGAGVTAWSLIPYDTVMPENRASVGSLASMANDFFEFTLDIERTLPVLIVMLALALPLFAILRYQGNAERIFGLAFCANVVLSIGIFSIVSLVGPLPLPQYGYERSLFFFIPEVVLWIAWFDVSSRRLHRIEIAA